MFSMVQLVSRQEIGLKKFCTELRRVVGLHRILDGDVITFLEALLNCQCHSNSGVVLILERNILGRLRSNCN